MEINRKFLKSIRPILKELKERLSCDFVVFGSAPLYLAGVLDFGGRKDLNDLDIVLRDEAFIPEDAERVLFHNDPRQAIYKLKVKGVPVDMGAPWPGRKRIHKRIFKDPIIVEGFKFANLEVVRQWKELMVKEYDRDKDRTFLKKMKEYELEDGK